MDRVTKIEKAEKIIRQLYNVPDDKPLGKLYQKYVRNLSRHCMESLNDDYRRALAAEESRRIIQSGGAK